MRLGIYPCTVSLWGQVVRLTDFVLEQMASKESSGKIIAKKTDKILEETKPRKKQASKR